VVDNESLVGQRAHFRDPPGTLFYFLAPAIVVFLIIAIFTREPHWVFAAIWPACYCALRLVGRRPAEDLVFQPDRIQLEPSEAEVPYDSIQGLKLNDGIVRGPRLTFEKGKLELVASNGVVFTGHSNDAGKVYEFLLRRIPASGSRVVSSRLQKHLTELLSTFDDDLIYTYDARTVIGDARSPLTQGGISLLLACALLIGLSVAVDEAAVGWAIGTGIAGFFFTGVGLLDRQSRSRPVGLPRWVGSSLIVSPVGIAVDQGDLVGKMHWDEIRKLDCGAPLRSFQMSRAPKTAINITIKGASFMILDLYDRPLAAIYEKMQGYRDAGETPTVS
jgi:hypothetical protein